MKQKKKMTSTGFLLLITIVLFLSLIHISELPEA